MPQLLAPDDLRPFADPLYQWLLPDWDVEIVRAPGLRSRGLTTAIGALRKARVEIGPHGPGDSEEETLAHELGGHVLFWPATELLDHSDPRTVALLEPLAERLGLYLAKGSPSPRVMAGLARAAAGLGQSRRFTAGLARTENCMDDIALILAALRAALTSTDVAGAVQALIDEISGMMPADALAIEEPAPVEGETMSAMMRRLLPAALARRAKPAPPVATLTDTGFAGKVLARLGVKSEAEALLRIAALKIADAQVADLSVESDMAARKTLVVAAMKRTGLGRPAFYVDGKDELLEQWTEGDLDALERTLATLKRGGSPLARSAAKPDPEPLAGGDQIPADVAEYAAMRGITDKKKIARLAELSRKEAR